jgi:uncharacterized protein (DUF4415 family)
MAGKKELYLRGNIWWYRYTDPTTGKQIRRSSSTNDKSIAKQILDREKAASWSEVDHPKFINLPLKPNQTKGTETISIRIPRWLIATFRAESERTGKDYQTLMTEKLIQAINISNGP